MEVVKKWLGNYIEAFLKIGSLAATLNMNGYTHRFDRASHFSILTNILA